PEDNSPSRRDKRELRRFEHAVRRGVLLRDLELVADAQESLACPGGPGQRLESDAKPDTQLARAVGPRDVGGRLEAAEPRIARAGPAKSDERADLLTEMWQVDVVLAAPGDGRLLGHGQDDGKGLWSHRARGLLGGGAGVVPGRGGGGFVRDLSGGD